MKISEKKAKELGLPVPTKRTKKQQEKADQWGGTNPSKRKKTAYVGDEIFDASCKAHGLPIAEHEYQFHPERKWKFDYLFNGWLALEVEGGAFTQGRHTRGQGFINDMEKYNEAAILGFTVIRCTPEDIKTGAAFALVKRAMGSEGEQ